MAWYRLAWQLGWPVQLLQRCTTNGEWLKWLRFMRQEANLFHREDWYFAKLAAILRATKGERGVTLESQLIHFTHDGAKPQRKRQSRLESKTLWAACMGTYADGLLEQVAASEKAE